MRRFITLFAGLAFALAAQAQAPAELAQHLKSDLAKWAKVVKDAGIKPE